MKGGGAGGGAVLYCAQRVMPAGMMISQSNRNLCSYSITLAAASERLAQDCVTKFAQHQADAPSPVAALSQPAPPYFHRISLQCCALHAYLAT